MRAAAVAGIVLAATLAGCLEAPAEGLTSATAGLPEVALPDAYAFACPLGKTVETGSGLCVSTIATLTESNQEPFLAIDPYRPGVMAVGVNAGHTTGAVDLARPSPGLDLIKYDVFVTVDGGATWTRHELPYIPAKHGPAGVDVGGAGDPALAFDEAGVLHASGIIDWGIATQGFEIFYTSSPDLGATWTEPVVFTDDSDNDRNWLNLAPGGRVFVPWQNVGDSSEVAYSLDSGATWKRSEVVDDCITVSMVAYTDAPRFACAGMDREGELEGIRVLRLDEATGAVEETAVVAGKEFPVWPQLLAAPDGSLLTAFEDHPAVRVATSEDGAAFSDTFDVRDLATLEDDIDYAAIYWVATDPWGVLHLLLGGGYGGTGAAFVRAGAEFRLVHVAVDPATRTLVSEAVVLDSAKEDPRTPPSLAPPYGDHYYGLAFDATQGYLVYTRDKGLDFTVLAPAWAGEGQPIPMRTV